MYDYLVVGAGLFGAVFACEAKKNGKKVLVVEKRDHVGGNVYTKEMEGIHVHKYGAHIFHTNDKEVWDYVTQYAKFMPYVHMPKANYHGKIYSLPFNMHTFQEMWGVTSEEEAKAIIEKQRGEIVGEPKNLEEQAISLVGRDVYEALVKGYTEKQWGRECKDLPAFVIKRLPVRFTFDNNYFNAAYQGIPKEGYTKLIEQMLEKIEVRTKIDYLKEKEKYDKIAKKVIFTGPIDAYYHYKLGKLQYRSLEFQEEIIDKPQFQEASVINYTDAKTPWTRIIEHQWFMGKPNESRKKTVITKEYPKEWSEEDEPYYPINDERNGKLYEAYAALAKKEENVSFGGRLGAYKYYDMDQVIRAALDLAKRERKGGNLSGKIVR